MFNKEFSMSHLEKSLWLSLIISVYILVRYMLSYIELYDTNALTDAHLFDNIIDAVVTMVTLEIVLQTIVAILDHKQADSPADERDKLISTKSYRNAYVILSFGVILCIAQIFALQVFPEHMVFVSSLSPLFNLLHWLVLAFLLAEITKLASQAYYYRWGC
jgi:hypothetical protein